MPDTLPPLPSADLDHVLGHTEALWDDLRGSALFITGATGFVGTWLLESALRACDRLDLDARVTILTRNPGRFAARSPHLAAHRALTVIAGDVATFAFPEGDWPFVIHAATERQFEPNAQDPAGMFERDVAGTKRMLEFAASRGTRRFLFTSSGAVYGRQPPDLPRVSEDYAGAPSTTDWTTSYGQAKRACEFLCVSHGRVHGFAPLIARLFAFVGPVLPLDANYAVGNFIRDVIRGGPVRIAGDGSPYRSYLYAADLAVWLWTILFRGRPALPYNVGSPDALSIAELADAVVDAAGMPADIEIAQRRKEGAAAARYVPEVRRAEDDLGLRVHVSIADGIRRTCEWHRAAC